MAGAGHFSSRSLNLRQAFANLMPGCRGQTIAMHNRLTLFDIAPNISRSRQ